MMHAPSRPLLHSVAIGFIVGYGVIIVPVFALILVFAPMSQHMSWAGIAGLLVFLPIALVLNAYLLAAMVMLGLWLVVKVRGPAAAQP